MNPKILYLFLLLLSPLLWGQLLISGTVKNEKGEAISGANVILSPQNSDETLAYFITKSDGKFILKLPSQEHEMYEVKVRAMNYAFQSDLVNESTDTFDFTLSEKAIELKEVLVKQPPIRKKGDTIAYDVSNFKDIQDRSIADVIKKIPGIEIESSGRILYQGEPINKYYIEGMDLLGGRYGLANENLSAYAVDKVQILENHQPIKMLDSLVYSSKAALNIKLKNKVTYSGKAEVGVGVSPLLYQANVTPMLFNKNQQMIGSFQANNRGEDVGRQLNTLSLEDLLNDQSKFNSDAWLNVARVQTPNFNSKRWLDNAVTLGTWNHLFKLGKDLELRLNIDYLNDYQRHRAESQTVYYLPDGELFLNEQKRNNLQIETLRTKLTLHRNSSANYLQNVLEYRGDWHRTHGYLVTNQLDVDQQLYKPNREFSNQFHIIKKIGKQLVTFKSNVAYKDYQEQLYVRPGVFESIFNNSESYQQALQHIDYQRLNADHFAEMTKGLGPITWRTKLGLVYTQNDLESQLYRDDVLLGDDYQNDILWKRLNPYLENSFDYRKNRIRTSLALPFRFYHLAQKSNFNQQDFNRFYFQPRLTLNYTLNNFWELITNHSFLQNFGNLSSLHDGFMLYNYNQLQQHETILNESKAWNSRLRFEYKNPIKSRFFHFSYAYNWTENDLMYRYQYNADASSVLTAVSQKNHQTQHNFSSRFSQYFAKIKTSVELNSSYALMQNDQFLNDDLLQVTNEVLSLGIGAKFRKFSWATFEYNYDWMKYASRFDETKNTFGNQLHKLALHIFPADQHYVLMNLDYYINENRTENPNTFFGDLMYRYTMKKRKIDIEFTVYNLFNQKSFYQRNLSAYYQYEYQYKLRPTQLMLTTRFTF